MSPNINNLIVLVVVLSVSWFVRQAFFSLGEFYLVRRLKNWPSHIILRHHFFPSLWVFLIAALGVASLPFIDLPARNIQALSQILRTSATLSGTWFMARLITFAKATFLAQFDLNSSDNLKERTLHTQIQFVEKAALICVWGVGLCVTLMTFEGARRLGASLITSAGIAGIVIGFAAQKTIANFLAGFQIAFTQPMRIDDVVVVEEQWGKVEEITLTYVVVCLWDLRRLVVPITYFVEKPFENWTRNTADVLTYAHIYADYTLPIEALRQEFMNILNSTPLWDRKVGVVHVTNWTEKSIELRALMSAADSSRAFDLKCMVREQLIQFMQRNHPHCLPQSRVSPPNPVC